MMIVWTGKVPNDAFAQDIDCLSNRQPDLVGFKYRYASSTTSARFSSELTQPSLASWGGMFSGIPAW